MSRIGAAATETSKRQSAANFRIEATLPNAVLVCVYSICTWMLLQLLTVETKVLDAKRKNEIVKKFANECCFAATADCPNGQHYFTYISIEYLNVCHSNCAHTSCFKPTGKRKNVHVKRFQRVIFVVQVHNWGSDNKMRSSSSSSSRVL